VIKPSFIPQLSIVIPVYNEANKITVIVDSWVNEMKSLGILYEINVYDDGSTDDTLTVLENFARYVPGIRIASHANRGHGPTIHRGYSEAQGVWVFQTDGDGEMSPESFGRLWSQRDKFDLLMGCRTGRHFSLARFMITAVSRLTVWTLFGRAIKDVNSPYRLIRRSSLMEILPHIPAETAAPNVLMSGYAARLGLKVFEYPVPHRTRAVATRLLPSWRFCKVAVAAFRQTIAAAFSTTSPLKIPFTPQRERDHL
jgi:glycosyltransferase involved in cell wall biosynthesis